jgi:hypothetical protein
VLVLTIQGAGFGQRVFVHSHETGNLALTPRTRTAETETDSDTGTDEPANAYEVMMDGYRAQMGMMAEAGLQYLVVQ